MMKVLPGSAALVAFGLGASFAFGMTGAALAGDLEIPSAIPRTPYKAPAPVVRPYDWTGFYIGGNAGGHLGADKITTMTNDWVEASGAAGAVAIDAASPTSLHPDGFIGGLQAGYNLQGTSGNVFGVEVDVNWLGGTATRTLTNIPVISAGDAMTNTIQASFLSTFRLRWGATLFSDRALFFLTGGFALENLKTTDSMGHFGNSIITTASNSITEPGVAAGAGIEYAFTDYLSVKGEYLFIYDKHLLTNIPATAGGADSIVVTHIYLDNILRAGLNFKVSTWSP